MATMALGDTSQIRGGHYAVFSGILDVDFEIRYRIVWRMHVRRHSRYRTMSRASRGITPGAYERKSQDSAGRSCRSRTPQHTRVLL
jgi:hypothetical protein